MTEIPEIATERLTLRAPAPADVDAWAAYLADPEVVRYLPKRSITPRERADLLFSSIRQGWQQQPVSDMGWVITQKGDAQLMGFCAAGCLPGNDEEAELVYSLGKPYWGQGFATEAARALVRFAFENTAWACIAAAIIPENIASRRVLEHLGFRYEKDVNYIELTGDTTIELDSPMVPYFVLRRDQFVPGDAFYRVKKRAS